MAKTLMQIFSRYLPDAENKKFLESAVLFGNMRVDKHARILEVDFSYSKFILFKYSARLSSEEIWSSHALSGSVASKRIVLAMALRRSCSGFFDLGKTCFAHSLVGTETTHQRIPLDITWSENFLRALLFAL